DVWRQIPDGAGDLLSHVLSGAFDFALEKKLAGYFRGSLGGHRVQFIETADGAYRFLDRQNYLGGDLFGRRSRQPDADGYRCRVGFWKQINAEILERKDPKHYQEGDEHHREYRSLYA